MVENRQDHRQFEDMTQQSLSGMTMIKKLSREFELLFDFKTLCAKFPTPSTSSYLENLELGVLGE